MSSFKGASSSSSVTLAATVVAVVVTSQVMRPLVAKLVSLLHVWRLKKQLHNLEKTDGSVTDLFIHPVKSLRAVSLTEVTLDEKGFVGDRRYMIVYPAPLPAWKDAFGPKDSTHRFLSQRQCPSLATIVAKLEKEDQLILECGNESLQISQYPPNDSTRQSYRAGIWNDQVEVQDMGDQAAAFIQAIVDADNNCSAGDLGEADGGFGMYKNVRLVCHVLKDRKCDPKFTPSVATSWLGSSPPVSLADGFPILIACQSSLDMLNEKLQQGGKPSIPMSRFRPNIVIQGTKPFDEDYWKVVAIGDQLFSIVRACARCKQSCMDQQTGMVFDEPVETMKSFRALGDKKDDVFFAQNAIPLGNGGKLRVGDTVRVLQRGDPVYS